MLAFITPAFPKTRGAWQLCRACATHSSLNGDAANAQPGRLYLVSTPIGNLGDISRRAVSILSTADIIAAEDTRRTGLLLKAVFPAGTQRKGQLLSCHEHNAEARTTQLLSALQERRQSVALVSDAGTPGVSDPGFEIVRAAVAADIPISPVPGSCAALAALVVSGLPLNAFSFFGFLPRAGSARAAALKRLVESKHTVVLYESPHRVRATLADLVDHGNLSERPISIARELTKKYETITRFTTVADANAYYENNNVAPRGEFVFVLGPPTLSATPENVDGIASVVVDIKAVTIALLNEGVPVKTISKSLSSATPLQKKALYTYVQSVKEGLKEAVL